jgi:hypothetical protein
MSETFSGPSFPKILIAATAMAGFAMFSEGQPLIAPDNKNTATDERPALGSALEDEVVNHVFKGAEFDTARFTYSKSPVRSSDLSAAQAETLRHMVADPTDPRIQAIAMCAVDGVTSIHKMDPEAANQFNLGNFKATRDTCQEQLQAQIDTQQVDTLYIPLGTY